MNRFICLKIWPRLPKQSTRAIRVLNDDSKARPSSAVRPNGSMTTDLYKLPDKDPIPKAKLITVESHDAVFSPEKPLVSNPPLNKNADSDDTAYYA